MPLESVAVVWVPNKSDTDIRTPNKGDAVDESVMVPIKTDGKGFKFTFMVFCPAVSMPFTVCLVYPDLSNVAVKLPLIKPDTVYAPLELVAVVNFLTESVTVTATLGIGKLVNPSVTVPVRVLSVATPLSSTDRLG